MNFFEKLQLNFTSQYQNYHEKSDLKLTTWNYSFTILYPHRLPKFLVQLTTTMLLISPSSFDFTGTSNDSYILQLSENKTNRKRNTKLSTIRSITRLPQVSSENPSSHTPSSKREMTIFSRHSIHRIKKKVEEKNRPNLCL